MIHKVNMRAIDSVTFGRGYYNTYLTDVVIHVDVTLCRYVAT